MLCAADLPSEKNAGRVKLWALTCAHWRPPLCYLDQTWQLPAPKTPSPLVAQSPLVSVSRERRVLWRSVFWQHAQSQVMSMKGNSTTEGKVMRCHSIALISYCGFKPARDVGVLGPKGYQAAYSLEVCVVRA